MSAVTKARRERPIEELHPLPVVLFFRAGEVWLGNFEAHSKLWAVANPGKRKTHALTEAQVRNMFHGFAEV